MAEQWWFKSFGEEMGPIGFADLVEAAQKGTLAKKDLVRKGEQGVWQKADSIDGLFPTEKPTQSQDVNISWIVNVLGEELGPLSLSELARMVRERELLPTDRIRRSDANDWIPAAQILVPFENPSSSISATSTATDGSGANPTLSTALPAGFAGTPLECADDLERLILELLEKPIEAHAKPSLAELGLAEDKLSVPAPVVESPLQESTAAGGGVTYSRISRWSPLNVFRRRGTSDESYDLTMAEQGGSGAILLPPIERDFRSAAEKATDAESESSANRVRRGVPWLELLLFLSAASLVFQIFPKLWGRLTEYLIAFVVHLDMRYWEWGDWVIAEIVVVVLLIGITMWGKSGK